MVERLGLAPQPSTVITPGSCKLTGCVANDKILNTVKTGCVDLPSGHYKQSDHTSEPCKVAPASSKGWTDPQPSSVTRATSCEFDCASGRTASSTKGENGTCDIKPGHVSKGGPSSNNAATQCKGGTVPNPAQTTCQNPEKGHYSKSGVETPCTAKDHSAFAENTGGLSTDACPFVCDKNYDLNADESACITCGVGQYLLQGACKAVSTGYVSKADIITQTECTGNTIPKSDKSVCVSNACPSSNAIGNGVGQLLVDGGGCTLVSCNGGYYEDTHNNSGQCTQIPANSGIYSPANDKGYSECSDSVTLHSQADWEHSAGIDSSAGCTWDCNTGYKLNSGKTGCDIKETLTQIALEANDLTDISNNQKAIKAGVTNLQFAITDSDVSWWYVTHTPPTTFSPKGKKTTDSTASETSRSWTNTRPAKYAMSNFDTEGEHRLYVWVADAAKQVKLDSVQSDPFIVDTSPPTGFDLVFQAQWTRAPWNHHRQLYLQCSGHHRHNLLLLQRFFHLRPEDRGDFFSPFCKRFE